MLRRFPVALAFALAASFTLLPSSAETLSLEDAQSQLSRLDADGSPDQAAIRTLWQETVDALKRVEESELNISESLSMLESAPVELSEINRQLSAPLPASTSPDKKAGRASLETTLSDIDAELAKVRARLANLTEQENRHFASQGEIPPLIADLRSSLNEIGTSDPLRPLVTASLIEKANFERNSARRTALATRISELEAGQKFFSAKSDLLSAKKRLTARNLERLTLSREKFERSLNLAQRTETAADRRTTASLTARFKEIPALTDTAARTTELAELRITLAENTAKIRRTESQILAQLETLSEQSSSAKRRIGLLEAAGLQIDADTGRLLRLQRAKLPTLSSLTDTLEQNIRASTEAQFQRLTLRDELAAIPVDLPKHASSLTEANVSPADVLALFEQYRENVEDTIYDSGTYIDELSKTNQATRRAIDEVRAYSLFIDERLLWIPSAPIIAPTDLTIEALTIKHLFSPSGLQSWLDLTIKDAREKPLLWLLVLFFIGLLIARRKRHIKALSALGHDAARRTCVSIRPTLKALSLTLLISLPLPLASAFLALRANAPTEFGIAFRDCAFFFATFGFCKSLCRPHGIFEDHFRIAPSRVAHLRKHLRWAHLAAPTLLFITTAILAAPAFPQSGRLLFFLLMVLSASFLHLLLRPRAGLIIQKSGHTWMATILHFIGIAIPASFATGTALGYISSVRTLRLQTISTIWIVLAGLFIVAVLTRWILVSRRRLARNLAVQKFKAANAAKKKSKKQDDTTPLASQDEIEANAVDVVIVEEQTTRLLRVGTLVVLAVVISKIWATSLPALAFLDSVTIWPLHETVAAESVAPFVDLNTTLTGGSVSSAPSASTPLTSSTAPHRISLQDLLTSALALLLTAIAARNIPGLLELTILRRLTLSPGGNYAITTVLRYIIVVFGMLCAFGVIGITWGSVQWLAAAVTLGIGFGLQEIFANFVAGIILLFERPMRLGDVVTIGDITGVVRKIQIRATTIQQFNNRELIVPNKEFITGQLVNWTLTDNRQRFDFNVGIAYGSDTILAEKILKQILADHPKTLNEPAPEVFFNSFGNSTLDFQIRAFIPEFSLFLIVQSELHFEIEKRFREADIEIAFPQQDIHIRSVPQEWKPESKPLPHPEPHHLRPDQQNQDAHKNPE